MKLMRKTYTVLFVMVLSLFAFQLNAQFWPQCSDLGGCNTTVTCEDSTWCGVEYQEVEGIGISKITCSNGDVTFVSCAVNPL